MAEHPRSWLKQSTALRQFEIGWRRLRRWAEEGLIRSVKLDGSQNGRRLYCAADLDRVLSDLAAGRTPRRAAAGRVSR